MKTSLLRASAVLLAVAGMAIAPAAAAAPASLEAPAPAPAITAPIGKGDLVTPTAHPCQVVPWFIFCRIW